jgi:hypothetical protein
VNSEREIEEDTEGFGFRFRRRRLVAAHDNGRMIGDGKSHTGCAVAHPEVEAFKKTGNPSAGIRKVR